jgi:hypothetical protein
MDNREDTEEGQSPSSGETGRGKLPYVKPAFRYEGVFETTALACGKAVTTQAQCQLLLKS